MPASPVFAVIVLGLVGAWLGGKYVVHEVQQAGHSISQKLHHKAAPKSKPSNMQSGKAAC